MGAQPGASGATTAVMPARVLTPQQRRRRLKAFVRLRTEQAARKQAAAQVAFRRLRRPPRPAEEHADV
jgi:hypothetical protein